MVSRKLWSIDSLPTAIVRWLMRAVVELGNRSQEPGKWISSEAVLARTFPVWRLIKHFPKFVGRIPPAVARLVPYACEYLMIFREGPTELESWPRWIGCVQN